MSWTNTVWYPLNIASAGSSSGAMIMRSVRSIGRFPFLLLLGFLACFPRGLRSFSADKYSMRLDRMITILRVGSSLMPSISILSESRVPLISKPIYPRLMMALIVCDYWNNSMGLVVTAKHISQMCAIWWHPHPPFGHLLPAGIREHTRVQCNWNCITAAFGEDTIQTWIIKRTSLKWVNLVARFCFLL